ncbi:MAG: hypothetical protein ACR2MY_08625 [Candidatus Dormibacteria bacterium]
MADAITVLEHDENGYYSSQGWNAEHVRTVSSIDAPKPKAVVASGKLLEVCVVAFAGDRGVSAVEVSTDAGESWSGAHIDYAPSRLTWALWTFGWTPSASGKATLMVRAYDGSGAIQESRSHGTVPDGATGLHHVEVRVA